MILDDRVAQVEAIVTYDEVHIRMASFYYLNNPQLSETEDPTRVVPLSDFLQQVIRIPVSEGAREAEVIRHLHLRGRAIVLDDAHYSTETSSKTDESLKEPYWSQLKDD